MICKKVSDLEGTRTPNPLIRSQKLYPLSHETSLKFLALIRIFNNQYIYNNKIILFIEIIFNIF